MPPHGMIAAMKSFLSRRMSAVGRGLGLAIVALAFAFAAGSAAAQNEREQDVLRRLMAEPVTLFDWGLAQLDRDIAAAADRVLPNRLGLAMGRPATGTICD